MNNANMTASVIKNMMILLTNNDPETFPYDQAYGPFNYWTKWDAIDNGDGTHSFHLNGKYLTTDDTGSFQGCSSINGSRAASRSALARWAVTPGRRRPMPMYA